MDHCKVKELPEDSHDALDHNFGSHVFVVYDRAYGDEPNLIDEQGDAAGPKIEVK